MDFVGAVATIKPQHVRPRPHARLPYRPDARREVFSLSGRKIRGGECSRMRPARSSPGRCLDVSPRNDERKMLPRGHTLKSHAREREMRPMTATKRAEPTIDQTTGNVWLPTCTGRGSYRPAWRASHMPSSAPMKPSAIETRQPPCEYPPMARPIEPHTPAIRSNKSRSINVIPLLPVLVPCALSIIPKARD